ncbi:unnamed protein product [Colias eurytheme]|nr:unnamed protein product [Colias eurytheme]
MYFIIFLFLTATSCEWVEISQTYHRNEPSRSKHKPNTNRVNEAGIKYKNETIIPKWGKGTIDRVENVGNVRRVPYASVKTTSIRPYMDIIETQAPEPYNYRFPSRVPETTLKPNVFEEEAHSQTTRIRDRTKFKNSTIFGSQIYKETLNKINENYRNELTTDTPNYLIDIPTTVKVSQKISEPTTSRIKQGIRRIYVDQIKKNPPRNNVDLEITTSYSTPIILPKRENIIKSNYDSNMNTGQESINKLQNKTDEIKKPTNSEDNIDRKPTNEQPVSQENKMEGLWRTIKVVAETISKHSRRTIKGKLKYLEDLKDSILNSIEYHIDRVWPDDEEDRRRSARSAHEHGHVEIPSSESALMTISFLTFAVFLIKLVLQLIHTYKQKTMMVTPAMVSAVGRAAAAFRRNRNHNHN